MDLHAENGISSRRGIGTMDGWGVEALYDWQSYNVVAAGGPPGSGPAGRKWHEGLVQRIGGGLRHNVVAAGGRPGPSC